jgi:hypothetical protein
VILKRLGRAFDNLGSHKKGVKYLSQALRLHNSPEGTLARDLEVADVLNYLAWAQAHTQDYANAKESAKASWEIRKALLGDANHNTAAALSDYSRMVAGAGDPGLRDRLFIMAMLTAQGEAPSSDAVDRKYQEIKDLAVKIDGEWARGGQVGQNESERLLRDYIKPYQAIPRISERLPWVLSQFGQYLRDEKHLPYAGMAVATFGHKLAVETLTPKHPDIAKTQQKLEEMKAVAAKPHG